MEYEIYRSDDELTHWGIRGMKWGVRRYQNKDGTLTPAGKKRYDAEVEKVRKQEKVLKNRQATRAKLEKLEARKKAAAAEKAELDEVEGKVKKSKKGKNAADGKEVKKSIKDMDDVELFNAINRARMEDTYRQLRPETVEKPKMFKKLVDDIVAPAATNAGKKFLENALTQAGAKLLEGKVDPDSITALTKARDKLKLKNEIEKLKRNDPDEDLNWGDRIKKQTWEKNEQARKDAEAAKAKQAAEDARRENEQRSREEYEKSNGGYRRSYQQGKNYTQSSNTWSGGIAGLLNSPKTDAGRQYLESTRFELLDGDGNVLTRYR